MTELLVAKGRKIVRVDLSADERPLRRRAPQAHDEPLGEAQGSDAEGRRHARGRPQPGHARVGIRDRPRGLIRAMWLRAARLAGAAAALRRPGYRRARPDPARSRTRSCVAPPAALPAPAPEPARSGTGSCVAPPAALLARAPAPAQPFPPIKTFHPPTRSPHDDPPAPPPPRPRSSRSPSWSRRRPPSPALAQQRALDHDDGLRWNRITGSSLSPNGEWLVYVLVAMEGDPVLALKAARAGADEVTFRGTRPAFTSDSRFVVYSIPPVEAVVDSLRREGKRGDDLPDDSLGVITVDGAAGRTIGAVENFRVAGEGSWVAYTPRRGRGGGGGRGCRGGGRRGTGARARAGTGAGGGGWGGRGGGGEGEG